MMGRSSFTMLKTFFVNKIKVDFERLKIMKEVQDNNELAKRQLIQELNKHLDEGKSAKTVYSIYKVMNKHYDEMKDAVGIDELLQEPEDEQECISQQAFERLRPQSPYQLKEMVNKKKFDPQKYLKHQRIQERMMGGTTFFRSITAEDPELLRQSLLKKGEFLSPPKKFMDKKEFSELKETSRLMHQYYSTDVNAPIELKKETRFMKKIDTNMKQLKKAASSQFLHSTIEKQSKIRAKMSRKIIDFSYNGIEKQTPIKATNDLIPKTCKL